MIDFLYYVPVLSICVVFKHRIDILNPKATVNDYPLG